MLDPLWLVYVSFSNLLKSKQLIFVDDELDWPMLTITKLDLRVLVLDELFLVTFFFPLLGCRSSLSPSLGSHRGVWRLVEV